MRLHASKGHQLPFEPMPPRQSQRITNADKRAKVKSLLSSPACAAWSNRQIAEYAGVTEFMVRKYRPSIDEVAAGEIADVRCVSRNGTQYLMNVSCIGKRKAVEAQDQSKLSRKELEQCRRERQRFEQEAHWLRKSKRLLRAARAKLRSFNQPAAES